MRIRMQGTTDGYKDGVEYDIPKELYDIYMKRGVCVDVGVKPKAAEPLENKSRPVTTTKASRRKTKKKFTRRSE